jgi:general secretion pathway protein G
MSLRTPPGKICRPLHTICGLFFVVRTFRWRPQRGFTLVELLITMTVLSILTLGVIPMVKTAVIRQREQLLREELQEMREAIKEFHHEALYTPVQCPGTGLQPPSNNTTLTVDGTDSNPSPTPAGTPAPTPTPPPGSGTRLGHVPIPVDPRSRVYISDCTLFGPDNPDHYPPKLETLVEGVSVRPIQQNIPQGLGANPADNNKLDTGAVADKKKIYLREIPVDPITGTAEWEVRSCYDPAGTTVWGGENVCDVRSKATGTALNGEKYSDW